jgi:DNA-binding PucR family transcriptional regulator
VSPILDTRLCEVPLNDSGQVTAPSEANEQDWLGFRRDLSRRVRDQGLALLWWDPAGQALVDPGGPEEPVALPGADPQSWPPVVGTGVEAPLDLLPMADAPWAPRRTIRPPAVAGTPVVALLCTPRARGRGPSRQRLDGLAADLSAQIAAHLELASARAQARRLEAVYQATAPVSAQIDLDAVLETVCERTRTLTGTDSAYITLVDTQRQDVYVRAAVGIRTEVFRHNRLRMGRGLGGIVATSGQTLTTENYLADQRISHDVDPEIRAEGLVALLAVPLRTPDGIIGVLYAAHHAEHSFDESEQHLVEMLADHAAVAIDNARLYQEAREALARERAQIKQLAELAALNEELTRLSLSTHDLDTLLQETGTALGFPVRIVPSTDNPEAVRVAAGGDLLGWLEPALPSEERESRSSFLQQAARVLAGHLMHDRALAQAQYRFSSDFLADLLHRGAAERAAMIRRAAHLGVDLTLPMAVAYVLVDGDAAGLEAVFQAMGGKASGRLTAGYLNGIVLAWPGRSADDLASMALSQMADASVRYTLGCASERATLDTFQAVLDEAVLVARGAAALDRWGVASSKNQVGAYGVLLAGGEQLRRFATRTLQPLVEYDERHGASMLSTLAAYLDNSASPTATARALNLHINSLYYRLQRISELGGFDLENAEVRFELLLALRVLRTATDTGAQLTE